MGKLRPLIKDSEGISEEFTSLPALAVLMIGVCLFLVLLTSGNSSINQQSDDIETIQTIEYIKSKICSPISPFYSSGGIVSTNIINGPIGQSYVLRIQKDLAATSINFSLKLSYDQNTLYILEEPPEQNRQRTAYSTHVLIKTNDLIRSPGILTIILWRD